MAHVSVSEVQSCAVQGIDRFRAEPIDHGYVRSSTSRKSESGFEVCHTRAEAYVPSRPKTAIGGLLSWAAAAAA